MVPRSSRRKAATLDRRAESLLLEGRDWLATKRQGMNDLEWKGCRQIAVGPFLP
jgi:hypothetical protein